MKTTIIASLSALLCSCTITPQDVYLPTSVLKERAKLAKEPFRLPVMKLGGKSSYARVAPDGERIEYHTDDEKSFRDGAILAAIGVGAWGAAVEAEASEATSQVVAKEGTKQATSKTAAELAAQKEANRHAEKLMEFEIPTTNVPVPVP